MGTVKFSIQSNSQNATVFIRLSLSAKEYYKRKTRETVPADIWNAKKGAPKNVSSGSAEYLQANDNLKEKLLGLERFVLKKYNEVKNGDLINGRWLEETIEAFYDGNNVKKLDDLINFLDYCKSSAKSRHYYVKP